MIFFDALFYHLYSDLMTNNIFIRNHLVFMEEFITYEEILNNLKRQDEEEIRQICTLAI